MIKNTPPWKVVLAFFSLLLTILIWQQGLQDSFERPSVSPKLALNQKEMSVLASPSLSKSSQAMLFGNDPKLELRKTLLEFNQDQIDNREKLLLALLSSSDQERRFFLNDEFENPSLNSVRKSILKSLNGESTPQKLLEEIQITKSDPLVYRFACLSIGASADTCIDYDLSRKMSYRLLLSQFLPLSATFLGICLIIRQIWIYIRKANEPWPEISVWPLSPIDMIILVAGGFVVLGELVTPLFVLPLADLFVQGIASPINESLKVMIGYLAMTFPPLLILRQQITSLKEPELSRGFFQWGFDMIPKGFYEALQGWLIVMPFVLLVSLLTNLFFGDPGGSNPLLEMVLSSKNAWALFILFFTTVLLAPLFEEFVFRGTLLPVLVNRQGRFTGVVISALIFALAHLSVGEMLPLFVLGIGLALLRLSSGRLLPCMIMHSLWNGVTFANLLILSA